MAENTKNGLMLFELKYFWNYLVADLAVLSPWIQMYLWSWTSSFHLTIQTPVT